jgi:hypothetical protein
VVNQGIDFGPEVDIADVIRRRMAGSLGARCRATASPLPMVPYALLLRIDQKTGKTVFEESNRDHAV